MLTFFCVLKEERVERIPECLIMTLWKKKPNIGFLNVDYCGEVDSKFMQISRYGALCYVFTNFCREVSKKGVLYAYVLDDIQKLQEKYINSEVTIVIGNSTMDQVRDPLPVKCKGAPKRKKKAPKFVRKCSNCGNTQHDARKCSASTEHLSVHMSHPASQKDKAKGSKRGKSKRKTCSASTEHLSVPMSQPPSKKGVGEGSKRVKTKRKTCSASKKHIFAPVSQRASQKDVAEGSKGGSQSVTPRFPKRRNNNQSYSTSNGALHYF